VASWESLISTYGPTTATDKVDQLSELLAAEVLQTGSISLARPDDSISEPSVLRRVDGSSVYTVAGSELYTSARLLAAEQRLVRTAGRIDGRVLDGGTVELALLESAANGDSLDAGQTALFVACAFQRAALTRTAEALKIPGFHPHETRHTAASLAIASGAVVKGRSADARTRARP
jgi:hypothetical protein